MLYYGVNGLALSNNKAAWGAIQEHCGVNDICTRRGYDEYGRVAAVWEAEQKTVAWDPAAAADLLYTYKLYGDNTGSPVLNRNVITEWRMPRCYGNFSRKVYNGLGQLIQVQRPQQNWTANADGCNPGVNATEVDVNYAYDALGNQTKISVPVATSASWRNRAANWSNGDTETIYDVAGRPARSYAPNEERRDYGYSGRATAMIGAGRNNDPDKTLQWQESDGLGHLKTVRSYQLNSSSQWVTDGEVTLTHDILGNLLSATHPNSIGTTTMSYDLAGRKTIMSDPDLGSWSYLYNRQNQLVRQTDARKQTICLYYDGKERLSNKHFRDDSGTTTIPACPSSPTYNVTYGYDANHGVTLDSVINNSRGQLTSVSNAGVTKALYYNQYGLLRKETVTISGAAAYTTGYGYDAYLRPSTVTHPDSEVVTQFYNSMGLPAKLTSSLAGDLVDGTQTIGTVATGGLTDAASYDETGRLTGLRFPAGGNLWRTQVYWPWVDGTKNNSNHRLKEIRVGTTNNNSSSDYNRLYLLYGYDSFGNVAGMTEQYNGGTASTYSFCYDAQNRLVRGFAPYVANTACTAYTTGQVYGYDTSGRMTSYEGSAQTVNTSFPGHAIKKTGYSYDTNGNVTARPGGQTLTWDHENHLSAISGGGLPTESYLYDDGGIRVKKTSNSVATYYVNQFYEVSGSTVTKYYYFGGQRIAMKKGTVLTYLHGDHLGSTVLETNTSGTLTADQRYYAYGKQRDTGAVVTDHKFTGQKLDGTGLQYFNARYYDPAIGTFISPDTIVPDAGNLFAYNRYMYTFGNPLKFDDPDGHSACLPMLSQMMCTIWQSLTTSSDRTQKAMTPEHDAIGVYVPFSSPLKVTGGTFEGTGGIEVIRNRHTGIVTAFSVTGAGGEGTLGAVAKSPLQVTFINQIDTNNLNYSEWFASVDVTVALELGLTFGYAYTPQQEFDGWKLWEYFLPDNQLSYSFIIAPAGGEGVSGSASYVYYTPLFSYVDGQIIPHHGELTQEQTDYLLPFVEQGIHIMDSQ